MQSLHRVVLPGSLLLVDRLRAHAGGLAGRRLVRFALVRGVHVLRAGGIAGALLGGSLGIRSSNGEEPDAGRGNNWKKTHGKLLGLVMGWSRGVVAPGQTNGTG